MSRVGDYQQIKHDGFRENNNTHINGDPIYDSLYFSQF